MRRTAGKTTAGFELQEDGQLQMSLLGAHTFTRLRTTARVNRSFELQSFEFALDPGTGPIAITGDVRDRDLTISIASGGRTRTEMRTLAERPMIALNLVRRLADKGLVPGARHRMEVFDPATLRNAPVIVRWASARSCAAERRRYRRFRVEMEFSGLKTTAWITDTGEIVREESPLGFITVRETAEQAQALAVSGACGGICCRQRPVVPEIERQNAAPAADRRSAASCACSGCASRVPI